MSTAPVRPQDTTTDRAPMRVPPPLGTSLSHANPSQAPELPKTKPTGPRTSKVSPACTASGVVALTLILTCSRPSRSKPPAPTAAGSTDQTVGSSTTAKPGNTDSSRALSKSVILELKLCNVQGRSGTNVAGFCTITIRRWRVPAMSAAMCGENSKDRVQGACSSTRQTTSAAVKRYEPPEDGSRANSAKHSPPSCTNWN
mmetsp:Transcript_119794/g.255621  ORF Transcript_119794/g.255621 Transcript_119794/m.255621 type:complete len:200 (+) Transcript_119794:432-1031(+)